MRNIIRFVPILLALIAQPLVAEERHQSYVSYDDGDAYVLQSGDDRQIEARVNLPVFPGDEVRTGRRGRIEMRLADGNIVALDRNSVLRFEAIRDAYESDDEQTIAMLDEGQVIVHRLSWSDTALRLDSRNASYVSKRQAIFSLESDGRGNDVVSVFEGTVEVRTEDDTDTLRAGEQAKVDPDGIYSSATLVRDGTTDFERWYLERSDRYSRRSSRYLGSRFAYYDYELDSYGSWVYVNDYNNWVWRPRVGAGWRPYYHGRWHHGIGGALTWVSDEPWGWMPYHYGRWAYSGMYGWVWIPGSYYSPAWVYWAYGPSYIGWVPAGWYECYRPYYNYWQYRPTLSVGLGFHGRVRFEGIDLGGWTFIDSNTLLSTRADRAALTTDAIRDRFIRGGGAATVSSTPARFGRDEIKDPAAAVGVIARGGGIGGGTGRGGSGSLADLTEFIRRDPELPSTVRDRIRRPGTETAASQPGRGASTSVRGGGSASVPDRAVVPRDRGGATSPRTPASGTVIDRTPRGEGSPRSGATPDRPRSSTPGTIDRTPREGSPRQVDRPRDQGTTPSRGTDSRSGEPSRRPRNDESEPSRETPKSDWRSRPVRSGGESGETSTRPRSGRDSSEADSTPRRVIDRIGGVRMERSGSDSDRPRAGESSRPRSTETARPRSSEGRGSRESSVDRSPSRSERSSGSSGSTRSSASSGSSRSSGSSGSSRSSGSSSGSSRSSGSSKSSSDSSKGSSKNN
jgi:hypothetical protein